MARPRFDFSAVCMPLIFHDTRTGASLRLDPERVLVGSAAHADVRLPSSGPLFAALLVRYASGWAIHSLTDHPPLLLNNRPIPIGRRAPIGQDDVVEVGESAYRVEAAGTESATHQPIQDEKPTVCHITVRGPDGLEECRVIDHDLLIGRLSVCHICYPDKRLSRVNALLACDAGTWYLHNLAKGPIGQNRQRVDYSTPLEDGDELQIGPLVLWVGIRADASTHTPQPQHRAGPSPSMGATSTEDHLSAESPTPAPSMVRPEPEPADPAVAAIRPKAKRLDAWLRTQTRPANKEGRQWVEKVRGFWADAHEATSARSLRNLGRYADAFSLLDAAIRARPDSTDLLWELYRLYRAAGMTDLCYRPLRQIEKLAERRGGRPDPRVLETLAKVCEELGMRDRPMFDHALDYWSRLEAISGVSYARERASAMAKKTMLDNQAPMPAGHG